MLDNALHPFGSLSQPTYEDCTLPSLQMNLECDQFFCLNEGKFPHEGPGYCRQHCFSLGVVAVLMLIHPCHALSGIIVDTTKYEDNSNYIFWDMGFLNGLKITLCCIFSVLSMHMLLPF